jgi:hypothetical protein
MDKSNAAKLNPQGKGGDHLRSALYEHRFWLQIMGDHARFILTTLSPKEIEEINKAIYFRDTFDRLLAEARASLPNLALMELTRRAYHHTGEFREFKLHLIRRHLTGQIGLGLSPSFINHMVNELDEYVRVMQALLAGQPAPKFHPVHYHLLWLQDGFGHAAAIAAEMDLAEKDIIEKSEQFSHQFIDFYLKAVEMAGFLRTNLDRFPALSRFNKQVELEMLLFQRFLKELEEMELTAQVLSTFSPLMADHMYREECYYLTKLSMVFEVNQPDCDPGKPRVEV